MAVKLRKYYETGDKVNEDPLVYVFDDFLSENEIEQLLAAAESGLQQSLVSATDSGVTSEGRTSSNCWVQHSYNPIVQELSLRIAEVVGIPLENAESLQVIHYAQDVQYAPHYDAWDKSTERWQRCMARGGQRMLTCLLYLNDVQAGGGTAFPNLDMEIKAKRRRMLLFHNCQEGSSARHSGSLHAGMPVLKGEKWACNFWFRELPYQSTKRHSPDAAETLPKSTFSRVID